MSSRSERRATAIWLWAKTLAHGVEGQDAWCFKQAVEALRPWAVIKKDDRALAKVQEMIADLIFGKESEETITSGQRLEFLHLLTALASDQYHQCPSVPWARKMAWLDLHNETAELIVAMDPDGLDGAELGCQLADAFERILEEV